MPVSPAMVMKQMAAASGIIIKQHRAELNDIESALPVHVRQTCKKRTTPMSSWAKPSHMLNQYGTNCIRTSNDPAAIVPRNLKL